MKAMFMTQFLSFYLYLIHVEKLALTVGDSPELKVVGYQGDFLNSNYNLCFCTSQAFGPMLPC